MLSVTLSSGVSRLLVTKYLPADLQKMVSIKVVLRVVLAMFGRVDEDGKQYLTVEDLKKMYLESKLPEGYNATAREGYGSLMQLL